DPRVIALDEQLKDTASSTELNGGIPLISAPPPAGAPSRAIVVPTLLILGARDGLFCGPPDGGGCGAATVAAQEAAYYSAQARLKVIVIPNTGHDLQLHLTAPMTDGLILGWLGQFR